MSETTLSKSSRKTAADYEATAARLLIEMNLLEEQMGNSRAESERLKVETQVLKAETDVIKAKTAATLSQLSQRMNSLTRPG